jgi:hypothetical protein
MSDTLVIGIGAIGGYVARRLEERTPAPPPGAPETAPRPELLWLDTDRTTGQTVGPRALVTTTNAAVIDAAYRAPERFHAGWIDREVLRGQTLAQPGSQGSRMLARFLLLLPENQNAFRERINMWLGGVPKEGRRPRIFVVAGAGGGTGGGQLLDVAYLIQQRAAGLGVDPELRALLFLPAPADAKGAPNAFATLTELHYFSDPFTRYRAHFGDAETPYESRKAPYHRVSLVTPITAEGVQIPLVELQERAAVYLYTAISGDAGEWEAERQQREGAVGLLDAEGNPQSFSTYGTEWVEYPEERLTNAVYRNLVRRSLIAWLQGDHGISVRDLPANVPLRDSEAMARLLAGVGDGKQLDEVLHPVRVRIPAIHQAPPHQWQVMDQELDKILLGAAGTLPSPGQPGRGPMADRAQQLRDQVLEEWRAHLRAWLAHDGLSLERIARVLGEAAAELRTATDPHAAWEESTRAVQGHRKRVLWAAGRARQDLFLLFGRRMALKKLAAEYSQLAAHFLLQSLYTHSVAYQREVRVQVMEPVRTWAARINELAGHLAKLSRAWADFESGLLERLRKDDEAHRLALGKMRLPGAETPYVANTGWNIPYIPAAEEAAAIKDLREGLFQFLAERPDGLLALPGYSYLDGPADQARDDRLPWLIASASSPMVESGSEKLRQAVARIDYELRLRANTRLQAWLGATAYQRLSEQFKSASELEYELRRLVADATQLPAIEPPHVRPAGFPSDYELIFFGDATAAALPAPLQGLQEAAQRERPTRVVPSRSPHYLTAIAEHPGFSLARCPAYHHLEEAYREAQRSGIPLPFSRIDVPWTSATLITRVRRRDASDVLYLALALGLVHPNPDGGIPLPNSLVPERKGERRFPLPEEFDLAVRQLSGDTHILEALSLAVDRTVQSKGVEWCALQVERVVSGQDPLPTRFPGSAERQQKLARLAALHAVSRHDDLLEEFARTNIAQDTAWLKAGDAYACPACAQVLATQPEAIPGACPNCTAPLLPQKLTGVTRADGFRRIPNPFVVGTPLETRSNVFVGREDIIEQVRDRLIRPASRTILILIGERRCGKTSALRQLKYRLEGDLTPLFIDMQGLTASDLPGFLYWLSWRMKEALDERGIQVDLPTFEEFTSGPPDYQFETVVLPAIRQKIGGGRLLLMLDEFEVLAHRVMQGSFDSRAFDYIRHLMQHGEGIEFLFAGTHVLRSFAANYVTFLFNIGVFLNVDFLRPQDALRLIQEPLAPSGVSFTEDALQSIVELAGAHAYFTQMFGFHMVERLNRLRKREVTRQDVEEEAGPVIAAAGAHLDHLWGQLSSAERLLIAYFVQVCPRGEKRPEDEVLQSAVRDDPSLRPFVFRTAVEKLVAVGLLRLTTDEEGDRHGQRLLSITAEVYRQWLQTQHAYQRLREEGLTWS